MFGRCPNWFAEAPNWFAEAPNHIWVASGAGSRAKPARANRAPGGGREVCREEDASGGDHRGGATASHAFSPLSGSADMPWALGY